MPLEAAEILFECENCEKSFKGLQVMHSILPKEDRKFSEPPVTRSDEELINYQ